MCQIYIENPQQNRDEGATTQEIKKLIVFFYCHICRILTSNHTRKFIRSSLHYYVKLIEKLTELFLFFFAVFFCAKKMISTVTRASLVSFFKFNIYNYIYIHIEICNFEILDLYLHVHIFLYKYIVYKNCRFF